MCLWKVDSQYNRENDIPSCSKLDSKCVIVDSNGYERFAQCNSGLSSAPDTENGSSIIVRLRDLWRSGYLSKS